MLTVAETAPFQNKIITLLTDEERMDLTIISPNILMRAHLFKERAVFASFVGHVKAQEKVEASV